MLVLKINGKRRRVNENIVMAFKAVKYTIYAIFAYAFLWLGFALLATME